MKAFVTLLKETWAQSSNRQAPLLAAGVAFYLFTSLIPAMIASLSIFGLFLTPEALTRHTDTLTELLPSEAATLIAGQLERLASRSDSSLSFGAVIATLVALWGALAGIANLVVAVNHMFAITERRSFLATRAIALALTLGAAVLLMLLIAVISSGSWWRSVFGDSAWTTLALQLVRWGVLAAALVTAMLVLFRIAPNTASSRRWIAIGPLVAAVGWLVTTVGFSLYVDNFGTYDKTYGALAGVVVLLLWLWIGVWIILLAAGLQSRLDARRTPTEPPPT